jgi:predicted nucleic acid-binding protein
MTIVIDPLFVDTSGWLAILNTRDIHHTRAAELWRD